MDTNKFDPELPSKHIPFAYVERETTITDHDNNIAVISFGALEVNNYNAPEFGGVAIVHQDPDIIIGIKYIPWNVGSRATEHDTIVKKIQHSRMNNQELVDYLYEDGYTIPAIRDKIRDEYERDKLLDLLSPEEIEEETIKKENNQMYNGEEIIPLDE